MILFVILGHFFSPNVTISHTVLFRFLVYKTVLEQRLKYQKISKVDQKHQYMSREPLVELRYVFIAVWQKVGTSVLVQVVIIEF